MKKLNKQFDNALTNFRKESLSDTKKQAILTSIAGDQIMGSRPTAAVAWWKQITAGLTATALFAFTGVAFASQPSIPGDPLYTFETSVVEPLVAFFQITNDARSDYYLALAEERIFELSSLVENQPLAASYASGVSTRSAPAAVESAAAPAAITVTAENPDTNKTSETEQLEQLFYSHIDAALQSESYDPVEIQNLQETFSEITEPLIIDVTPVDLSPENQQFLTPEQIEPLL